MAKWRVDDVVKTGVMHDHKSEDISDLASLYSRLDLTNQPFQGNDQPLIIKGASSQTANLQEIQNNAGILLAGFDKRGIIFSHGGATNSFFAGLDVAKLRTTATQNIGIGDHSLFKVTSASYNVAIGSMSLFNAVNVGYQVGIGTEALYKSNAMFNTAIGYRAGYELTGSTNTAIGAYTLQYGTTAEGNLAFGYASLRNITTGKDNIGIGNSVLYNVGAGRGNIAIGAFNATHLTSSYNIIFGYYTGYAITTASHNTILGAYSGYKLKTGAYNITLGNFSLRYTTSSYYNVALGGYAGEKLTGNGNTLVGHFSGRTCNALNVMVGREAGFYNTGSSNIFIGYRAGYNETGSNLLYIANSDTAVPLIWGNFSTKKLKLNADVYIPSDSYKLHLGAGNDMSIWYDGIDAHIKTSDITASDLKLDCGTNKTLELVQLVYDDQQVNLGEVAGSGWFGSPGVDIVEYRSGSAIEFKNSTSNSYKARFNAQLSHRYAEGEDIEFHIHIGNDGTSTGNVVFKLTYQWANMEGTYSSSTSVSKTFAIDGTDGKHQMEEIIANITGTGKKISSILLCTLERDAGNANDTFSGSVYVIGLDFHLPINTEGSRQIGTK